MKKTLLTILSAVCIASATAQNADTLKKNTCEKGHYLFFDLGGGLHNIAYSVGNFGDKSAGLGFMARGGYRYFFTPNWGFGIGANYHTFGTKATLNFDYDVESQPDPDALVVHNERNYKTSFNSLKEKDRHNILEIPVGIYFQHSLGNKWKIGAGLNVFYNHILSQKYETVSGDIRNTAEYPWYNLEVYDLPEHGYYNYSDFSGDNKLDKSSFGFGGELTFYYPLTRKIDLNLGLYGSYAGQGRGGNNPIYDEETLTYPGVMQSDVMDSKAKNISCGLMVGLRFHLKRKEKPQPTIQQQVDEYTPLKEENICDVATVFKNNPDKTLLIVGDTCTADTFEIYCADAVKSKMLECGADGSQIFTANRYQSNISPSDYSYYSAVMTLDKPVFQQPVDTAKTEPEPIIQPVDTVKTEPEPQPIDTTQNDIVEVDNHQIQQNTVNLQDVLDEYTPVYFDLGAVFGDPEMSKKLDNIAEALKQNPDKKILIIGHTCDLGILETNKRVGYKRAETLRKELVKRGTNPQQIAVESRWYKEPLVPNTSEANRIKNRRAEFRIVK